METNISNYGSNAFNAAGTNTTATASAGALASAGSLLVPGWETSSLSQSQTQKPATAYSALPSNPMLLSGQQTDPSAGQAGMQHLFDFPSLFNNLVASGSLPQSDTMTDEEVTDPDILALADKDGESPASVYQLVQAQASSQFTKQLNQLPQSLLNAFPNAKNQLLFAFNNPGQAASLPQALQTQLSQMTSSVNSSVAQQYGFSSSWSGVPPDSDSFNTDLSNQYGTAFQNALQSAAASNNLSDAQVQQLTTTFYDPSAAASITDPQLQSIFNSCQASAASTIQTQYSIDPSTYTLTPNTSIFTQTLNGAYMQTANNMIQNYSPPLTTSQQQQIQAYLADPTTSVDADIPGLAQTIKANATASVIAQFQLSTNWQPTVSSLTSPLGLDPNSIASAQNALDMGKELQQTATNVVSSMPPGPTTNSYVNFLKAISSALTAAQNAIYAIEGAQSQSASRQATAQVQTQLQNLSQQISAVGQMEAAQAKMVKSGLLNTIMDVFMKIFMVVACLLVGAIAGPLAGLVALAFTMFFVIDSAVAEGTGKTSLVDQAFQQISTKVDPKLAPFINAMLSVVLSGGNPMVFMTMLFSDANVVGNTIKAYGGDAKQQMIGSAVTEGIVMISAMIVMTVLTFGAGSAGLAEAALGIVNRVMDTAVELSTTAERAIQVTQTVVQVVSGAAQAAQQGITINNELLLGQIAKIQGDADSNNQQVQAIVEIMQMLIKKLLDMLSGEGSTIANISNLQGKKWSNASDIATQITSASPS
jgi:hypothetical protein